MAVVSTEVAEPTWMHVAAIFDGGTLELYVDGALEASTSDVGYSQIPSHGGGSRIGVATLEDGTGADAFGSDSDADYAGLIDVVAVYDRVLSPAEVGTLAGALDPEPVVGTVSPTDPDGDSDYEDIDGDEQVTSDDLEAYAEHIDDPELTDQIAAFDFNDNDRIDHGDLIELFLESQQ
jgi:PKD repeat protein